MFIKYPQFSSKGITLVSGSTELKQKQKLSAEKEMISVLVRRLGSQRIVGMFLFDRSC